MPAGLAGWAGAFGAGLVGWTGAFGAGFWFAMEFTYLSNSFETNSNGVTGGLFFWSDFCLTTWKEIGVIRHWLFNKCKVLEPQLHHTPSIQ